MSYIRHAMHGKPPAPFRLVTGLISLPNTLTTMEATIWSALKGEKDHPEDHER